jgi:alkylation response protein AidB-like acyl-CoA dehydrogenase
MFDLDVSDERLAVADLGRGLAMDVLSPAAKRAERERAIPAEVRRSLHETGLTTLVGEAFGGGGIPTIGTHMVAVEAMSYGDPGLTVAALWAGAGAILLGQCGTADQTKAYLPTLATDASASSVVALYEGFGRSPSEYTTTINQTAAGRWRVSGTKLAVPHVPDAGSMIVVGNDPGDGRMRAVIFPNPASYPGVTVTADDERIALGAAPTSTVIVDAEVGADQLLGGAEADSETLNRAVGWVRLMVAAAQCGTAQRATDYASKYATERIAFGKPIATFQGVSFMLADSAMRIGVARLEMLDAAAHLDEQLLGSEGVVSRAVNYCGVVGTNTTRDAIQVLGGHGFITDHPVELWYRSSAALSVLDHDPLLSNFEPAM